MFAWLAENLGTIVISAVLLAIVAAIVIYLIRQKKQGKSTCGAGCTSNFRRACDGAVYCRTGKRNRFYSADGC